MKLKPSDTKRALRACFEARENVAQVANPGMGKSSFARQVTAELEWDWLCSNPSLEDSTEPGGLPWFANGSDHAEKKMFGIAYRALHAVRPTVWHWEDFGHAAESTQKSYMQWAEAREIDGHRLPDCVAISMATNPRGKGMGVSGMLEPIKSRFTLIEVVSDLDDFCQNLFDRGQSEYGLNETAIVQGAAFLRSVPDMLNKWEPSADMVNCPNERNWVHAMRHTMHGLPKHIERALIQGRVGEGATSAFCSFLDMLRAQQAFNLDLIFTDPINAPIPDNTSAQWCVAVGVAARANDKNFQAPKIYLERMEKMGLGEFATVSVLQTLRNCPRVASTYAYIEMMTGPLGKLMQGRV